MFHFICKKVFQTHGNSTTLLCFLQNPHFVRYICNISTNQNVFRVSYLMESCGLSKENAISAAKKIRFETSAKPDSVLAVLRNCGFTETQISTLVFKNPSILAVGANKTLEPKVKFFHSIGFSSPDLAKILYRDPHLFTSSLEKRFMPTFDFLKSVVHSDRNVVAMLKRSTRVLVRDPQKELAPNIGLLRDIGVPDSRISMLLITQPRALLQTADRFSEVVDKIMEMGFSPLRPSFVHAIHGLTCMSKLTWEAKLEVYRKWGWSEDEIHTAFRKQPFCMMLSEKKIMRTMDFFVNKMGCDPSNIAKCPVILMFSLEKRIIPRCSVIKVLISKGLVKKDWEAFTSLKMVEEHFLKRFVTKYEKMLPELLMVYQGKKNELELPIKSEGGELKML